MFGKKNVSKISIVLLLITIIINVASVLSFDINDGRSVNEEQSVYERFLKAYSRVYELSRQGINTTVIVSKLKTVHKFILNKELDKAEKILDDIEKELDRLYNIRDQVIYTMLLERVLIMALILSIPLLFYILFPKIYLTIWFKTRSHWRVRESGHT